ncbi:DUF4886 domain-containing protein [Olleya sp. YS]|uniref:DUF4886 domain-containing protein n=1 Tax=Olleya sp. YS TaxID=3028318 RepID=UPI0024343C92|nr:DUF4886 domain-containing protein [Olleya sp. YS]WGD33933.1 DUF4886 domain-containing protein [Olleya sp. YS]
MKNALLIILAFIIVNCKSQSQESTEELNVLFIGNSLTFYHDMPQMVQKMLNETNPNIKIHQSTFPGMFLGWHLDKTIVTQDEESISVREKSETEITETEKKLSEKKWDIIILQEGTIRVLIPELRNLVVDSSIKKIKKFVNNPNCRFILFNTWASKIEYPKEYCHPGFLIDDSLEKNKKYCSENIKNLKQHNDVVNLSYQKLADKNNIEKSNNGNLFFKTRVKHPEIELFDDSFHPSKYGSFLNACEFYQILSSKKAIDLKYIGEIEPKTAELLKRVAE